MQIKDFQGREAIGNNREVRIGDTRIEGARDGLREIQLQQAAESGGHLAEHVGPSTSRKLLPFGALQVKPSLAYKPKHVLVLLALQPRQNRPQLIVPQNLVYAHTI